MGQPSTWNTMIAILYAVGMFWAFFTGVLLAITIAVWVPYAILRKFFSLARVGIRKEKKAQRALRKEEGFFAAPEAYAFIERLSRKTTHAWPKSRF